MTEPVLRDVQCLDSRGLHRMAYWQWGDAANPKVLVCVHGLTRQGRDFDTLARALAGEYRVVCPDIVGRGRSDWLADPMGYSIPHYVADMVCLLARLDAQVLDWVGTSMGGLIGLGLASLEGAPVRRLVLNDVGPVIEPAALQRIGSYVGQSGFWATLDEAADAAWALSQGFGAHSREQWLALTAPQLKPALQDGRSGFTARCDPAVAVPLRSVTPELARAGEALLWHSYDRLQCPTLLLRGAESDLLSRATAQAMTQRGPRAQLQEFAGVGHAPTLVHDDQIEVLRRFLPVAMKTLAGGAAQRPEAEASPIVRLADAGDDADALRRARAFAEPLLTGQRLDTGEYALAHADGVAAILQGIGAAPSMRAAAFLVYAGDYLQRPEEVVSKAFGETYAALVSHTRKLVQIQRSARDAQVEAQRRALQTERVRKMLLAFASDLRVVLLRLASRLQTLRWYAASKHDCPEALARESLDVFAPLANRLGIWQIKWELEDLAFRFLQRDDYRRVAALMDGKRQQREAAVERARLQLAGELAAASLRCEVQGRPKHLYSVWKKMQGKGIDVARIFDLRALRIIVADVPDCYAALARVHDLYVPLPGEFDDYIAKPKANGYQSLHTVVRGHDGAALEVQIRTRAMHEHAEHGVAAHWAYKEAGARGYAGVSAAGDFEERVAEARRAVLRQLLAWEREVSERDAAQAEGGMFDDRIYVFTPQAAVIELPAGATPVDFAYSLHTSVGHRCRGARVDGALVPLHTPLRNGQTVEIIAAKDGGPSRDWLNAEPGYLKSPRARAKVRAWFNAQQQAATIARGRELVEKLLQREGRTALKLEHLAEQLGFKQAEALFEAVGKDEYSLHQIENLLRPPAPAPSADEVIALRKPRVPAEGDKGGVLVVGVESLLTTLARCCRPAPPDAIGGFVTRGKGVAIHRADCSNLRHMVSRAPERLIAVAWGTRPADATAAYAVDLLVEAEDRQGLLRDISELLAKEKMNVVGVHTQSVKDSRGSTAWMIFTVEVSDTTRLAPVLAQVGRVSGVRRARRK